MAGAGGGGARAGGGGEGGPWAEVGMAAGGAVNARLQAQGWGLVGVAEGLAALGLAVGAGAPPVVAMMPISWGRMLGGGAVPPPDEPMHAATAASNRWVWQSASPVADAPNPGGCDESVVRSLCLIITMMVVRRAWGGKLAGPSCRPRLHSDEKVSRHANASRSEWAIDY